MSTNIGFDNPNNFESFPELMDLHFSDIGVGSTLTGNEISVDMDIGFLKNVNAFCQIMLAQQGYGPERVDLVAQINALKLELETSKLRVQTLEDKNAELVGLKEELRSRISRLKSDTRSLDFWKQKSANFHGANTALLETLSDLKKAHHVIVPCVDGEVFLRFIRKADEKYLSDIDQHRQKITNKPVASGSSGSSGRK